MAVKAKALAPAAAAAKDAALMEYLRAYEDFLVSALELQTILKDGNLHLFRARQQLARMHNSAASIIGPLCYPAQIAALARIDTSARTDSTEQDFHELKLVQHPPGTPMTQLAFSSTILPSAENLASQDAPTPAVATGATAAELDSASPQATASANSVADQLRKLGVGAQLRQEIEEAFGNDGQPIGVICGDTLAFEGTSGPCSSCCALRSSVSMAPSGQTAQREMHNMMLQSQMREGGAGDEDRLTQGPDPAGDPARWFSVTPPLALFKSQSSFVRAVEICVRLANLRTTMVRSEVAYLRGDGEKASL